MKRKTAILCIMITGLMLAAAMCGCKRQPDPDPGPTAPTLAPPTPTEPTTAVQTDATSPLTVPETPAIEYRTDTRERTVTQEGQELLTMHFSVPIVDEAEAISGYYRDWLSDQEYYAALEEETARERYAEAAGNDGVFMPFAYESDYMVMRNDGVLFCVLRDFYENTGGARPAYKLMAENFIVAEGAMLVLADVFTVPKADYEVRIRDAVLAQLADKTAEMGQDLYYENIGDTMMEIFDARSFCLTDTALIVFWQNAELAPAIAGVQQFEIPLEELADILDPWWLP